MEVHENRSAIDFSLVRFGLVHKPYRHIIIIYHLAWRSFAYGVAGAALLLGRRWCQAHEVVAHSRRIACRSRSESDGA